MNPRHPIGLVIRVILAAGLVSPMMSIVGATSASAATCTKYTVIGLRGNGETYNKSTTAGQIGAVAAGIYTSLAATAPFKGAISAAGVPEQSASAPALGAGYLEDVRKAGTALSTFLPKFHKGLGCRTPTKYILIGYSQGAYEIRAGLQTLAKSSSNKALLAKVKAIVLIADPAEKGSGILRVNASSNLAVTNLSLLNESLSLCTTIDNNNWPFPDCAIPAAASAAVRDIASNWTSLGTFKVASTPTAPTLSYSLPGDGIGFGATLITSRYLPAVKSAQDVYNSSQVGRFTATVDALQTAYKILDDARRVHGQYAASAAVKSSVVTWLAKNVK